MNPAVVLRRWLIHYLPLNFQSRGGGQMEDQNRDFFLEYGTQEAHD